MRINEIIQEAEPQPDRTFESRCEAIVEKIATVAERYQQTIRSSSIWITSGGLGGGGGTRGGAGMLNPDPLAQLLKL
jgi:hypothetical protein